MDWNLAINRNRDALLRVLSALFAMIGATTATMPTSLPRRLHRAILLILRPAESAVRRLIIIAARGLILKSRPAQTFPAGLIPLKGGVRVSTFCLIDPLKRFTFDAPSYVACPPRISVPGYFDPVFAPVSLVSGDEQISVASLMRRLQAIERALSNLSSQARRLARWYARHSLALPKRLMRSSPMRPGYAPGHRQRPIHEIDIILRECHALARDVCEQPNTS